MLKNWRLEYDSWRRIYTCAVTCGCRALGQKSLTVCPRTTLTDSLFPLLPVFAGSDCGTPGAARFTPTWRHASTLYPTNRTFCPVLQTWLHCVSKNVPLCNCPYLWQILANFRNSFTRTLFGQFAIKQLLNISPHHNCVATLPCEI